MAKVTEETAKNYCWNCGQKVAGKTAAMAARLGVAFCCYCGTRLDGNGDCQNQACPWCGRAPQC